MINRTITDDNGFPTGQTLQRPAAGPAAGPSTRPKKPSDYILAKRAVEEYGFNLVYVYGEFWRFEMTNGWVQCSEHFRDHCNKIKGGNSTNNIYSIALDHLKIAAPEQSIYWERVGEVWCEKWQPLTLTNTQLLFCDYIVDLITDQQTPLDTRVISGPRITLEYAEPADRDMEFENLVAHAQPDPEMRRHFQEVMGAVLIPHFQLRSQIIFYGAPHTGKTTIATAIGCAAAGRAGFHGGTEFDLATSRWEASGLINKFCNISDESPITPKWVPFMKRYTSGNVRVEQKYGKPQCLAPTAKLISTSNELQNLSDPTNAVSHRILVFRFDNPIPRTNSIHQSLKMTSEYWSQPARRNAVATWLLEGAERFAKRVGPDGEHGAFDPPQMAIDEIHRTITESDDVESILKEKLISDPEGFVPLHVFETFLPKDTSPKKLARYMRKIFEHSKSEQRGRSPNKVSGHAGVSLVQ